MAAERRGSRGRRRRGIGALGAAAVIVTAGVVVPQAASGVTADPRPGPLEARLERLIVQAGRLTQQYNKTGDELRAARQAEDRARRRARVLQARAAAARAQLGELAAGAYMSRGELPLAVPGEGMSDAAYLVESRRREYGRIQARLDAAERAKAEASRRSAEVRNLAARRDAQREQVAEQIFKVEEEMVRRGIEPPGAAERVPVKVPGSGLGVKAVNAALTQLGKPYAWGAEGPGSYDCSGLVMWAYGKAGRALPHYTGSQHRVGTPVPRRRLKPGDIVFFGAGLHHNGLYVGGGRYVHAPQTGDVVKVSLLRDRSDYHTAVRID